jgi:demethylmenaquinone methyltransferase/2-methoxy-6-polyprenyl-1,4-benzoquinol methylase
VRNSFHVGWLNSQTTTRPPGRVSSDPAAYVYLAESIRAWPDQAGLAAELQRAGWESVAWRDLTGGIVALHRGTNPPAAS